MSEPTIERTDPGRAGVKAGRVVGVLTAGLAVASLLAVRSSYAEAMGLLLDLLGIGGVPIAALFWGNLLLVASARYAFAYVVGSLVGVLYDWLDRPGLAFIAVVVLVVGGADGTVNAIEARSALVGGGYLLAWLCYVPIFAYLFDPGAGDDPDTPRRLE